MSKVSVASFSISLDGFGAGPNQDAEHPLGVGGMDLHRWLFSTRTFQRLHGDGKGGATGVDDEMAARGFENVGAWILGRNMFGPVRGPWPDEGWRGWWGEDPPYHVPVFVLTHHARPTLSMEGGNVFHFVTGGIHEALERAKEAAHDKDVRIGGGPNTIRQFLRAGLVDEMHLAVAPVLLGRGEPLFVSLDFSELGFVVASFAASELAAHYLLRRRTG